jgi:hypothetical protein
MDMQLIIFKALLYISYFSIVVPFSFLLKRKHVLRSRQFQIVAVLLIVSVIADVAGYILIRNELSNLVINNLYFLISFVILSLLYARLLSGGRTAVYVVIVVSICFFAWDSLTQQSISGVQSYIITLCSVLALGYSLIYFDQLLHTSPASDLAKFPFFWINSAFMYYYGMNLFIFIFSTYIFENLKDNEILVVWIFHNVNNTIKNILLATGIYNARKQ